MKKYIYIIYPCEEVFYDCILLLYKTYKIQVIKKQLIQLVEK